MSDVLPDVLQTELRMHELHQAIQTHALAGKPVPQEWIDELTQLIRRPWLTPTQQD
jgi:hypothetical protein